MADFLGPLLVGLLAGVIVTIVLMRRGAEAQARGRFESWRATDIRRIRRDAVDTERSTLKDRVGGELAQQMEPFPFVPADTRFIGNPVQFVVFDGHTEVKDRSAETLRGVVFVSVNDDASAGNADRELVEECVAGGRLSWLTLSMGKPQSEGA